ncbi:MAG: hypothetical protein LH472_06790 [Pyrinomonadaceae bacterium]|nr:hypothetical protein [Pyrinomonadaceae bacterium]
MKKFFISGNEQESFETKKESVSDKVSADEDFSRKLRRAVKNVAVPAELEAKVLNLIRESG